MPCVVCVSWKSLLQNPKPILNQMINQKVVQNHLQKAVACYRYHEQTPRYSLFGSLNHLDITQSNLDQQRKYKQLDALKATSSWQLPWPKPQTLINLGSGYLLHFGVELTNELL